MQAPVIDDKELVGGLVLDLPAVHPGDHTTQSRGFVLAQRSDPRSQPRLAAPENLINGNFGSATTTALLQSRTPNPVELEWPLAASECGP